MILQQNFMYGFLKSDRFQAVNISTLMFKFNKFKSAIVTQYEYSLFIFNCYNIIFSLLLYSIRNSKLMV